MLPGFEPNPQEGDATRADHGAATDGVHTWRVGELGAHLERLLAGAFPGDVWVEGQIRNLSRSKNGHVYFDLVEPVPPGMPVTAQVPVALLAAERQHVNRLLTSKGGAVRMDDGIEVRIMARIRWYRPGGRLQLRMMSIDPAFTLGRLAADRERTLAALRDEGLLDANGRLALPAVPLRVGLVTSLGSAAHADFLAEIEASAIGFTVFEADARVQGVDCEPSIVAALTALARLELDVVALVRGGGARTDLSGFDSATIARAIAAMPVPVLTGIGHEIDRSIADEVAHTALKTPTAVADHLIDRILEFRTRASDVWLAASRAAQRQLDHAGTRLGDRARRGATAAGRSLLHQRQRVDALAPRTAAAAGRALDRHRLRLDRAADVMGATGPRHLARAERSLAGLAARARAHDPVVALRRGWSITRDASGGLVRTSAQEPGTRLVTELADGIITSDVVERETHPSFEHDEEPT